MNEHHPAPAADTGQAAAELEAARTGLLARKQYREHVQNIGKPTYCDTCGQVWPCASRIWARDTLLARGEL